MHFRIQGSPYVDLVSSFGNISWNDELISAAQDGTRRTDHFNHCFGATEEQILVSSQKTAFQAYTCPPTRCITYEHQLGYSQATLGYSLKLWLPLLKLICSEL